MPKKKTKYSIVAESLLEALESLERTGREYVRNPDSIRLQGNLTLELQHSLYVMEEARKALNGETA